MHYFILCFEILDEILKLCLQEVYNQACEALSEGSGDGDGGLFSAKEIQKKIKAVVIKFIFILIFFLRINSTI